jgi:hypothetical protein
VSKKAFDPSGLKPGQALRHKPKWANRKWRYVRFVEYEEEWDAYRVQYWAGPEGTNSYTFSARFSEDEEWELVQSMDVTDEDLATPVWWATFSRPYEFELSPWTVADLIGSTWMDVQYRKLSEDLLPGFDSDRRINLYGRGATTAVTHWLSNDDEEEPRLCIARFVRFDTETAEVKQEFYLDQAVTEYRAALAERDARRSSAKMERAKAAHAKYVAEGGDDLPLHVLVNMDADAGDQLLLL